VRATTYLDGPLDPAPLRRISEVPIEQLRDPEYLSEELLPEMGLTSLDPGFFPPQLHPRMGRGVQPLQSPRQLGPYLSTVAGEEVRSYLEVGVEHGGTFAITVEFLRRFGLERALAVDLGPTPLLLQKWKPSEVTFAAADSHSRGFRRLLAAHDPFDLAFIDGDHSEAGLWADFEAVRPHARMLAFHDIVEPNFPDVGRVWRRLRAAYADVYEFHDFVAQYEDTPASKLGIGLAIRR
jgi:hypothetical protein